MYKLLRVQGIVSLLFDNQLIQILYIVLLFTFLTFSICNVNPR